MREIVEVKSTGMETGRMQVASVQFHSSTAVSTFSGIERREDGAYCSSGSILEKSKKQRRRASDLHSGEVPVHVVLTTWQHEQPLCVSLAFDTDRQRVIYVLMKTISCAFKLEPNEHAVAVVHLASALGWEQRYAVNYGSIESFLLKDMKRSLMYRGYQVVGLPGEFRLVTCEGQIPNERVECFGEKLTTLVLDRIQVWMESHRWTIAPVSFVNSTLKWETRVFGPVGIFLQYLESIAHPLFRSRIELIRRKEEYSSEPTFRLLARSITPVNTCRCLLRKAVDENVRSSSDDFVDEHILQEKEHDICLKSSRLPITALSQKLSFSFYENELDVFDILYDVSSSSNAIVSSHSALLEFHPSFEFLSSPDVYPAGKQIRRVGSSSSISTSAVVTSSRASISHLSSEDSLFIHETIELIGKKKDDLSSEIELLKAAIAKKKSAMKRKLP